MRQKMLWEAETIQKKILFCASTLSHLKNFHLPYLKAFREQGYEVWAAAAGTGEVPYADYVVKIPFQKQVLSPRNLQAVYELYALMKRERFDILSAHTTLAGALSRSAVLFLKKRPQVFYTCHGYLFTERGGLRKWGYLLPEKFCAKVTDVLMTMNAEDYEIANRHHLAGGQLCAVDGMGFDDTRFVPLAPGERPKRRAEEGFGDSEVVFLYAAEFSKRKNQSMLIRAFARVLQDMPEATLLLAGEGAELEPCRALADKLGVAHKIRFAGHIENMAALVPLCDVVATPSRSEGLPFHLMEAMSCGLPAVASDVKGHRDLVEDGKTGFLFPPEQEAALAEGLQRFYRDPELRAAMGANARGKATAYGQNSVVPQILRIYGLDRPSENESCNSPCVSVLMGVYHPGTNTGDLCRAVESILSQSFRDFEFLICDDGSSDTVRKLLSQYALRDRRIHLVRPGGAFTLPDKLNHCIRAARGTFFARQDADDRSAPDRLEKQIGFLRENPKIAFVGCNVNLFCNGQSCGKRRFPMYPSKRDFLFSMPFIHPTLVFRRSAMESVGGYSRSRWAILCEDYDLLLRMYEKGLVGSNLQEPLFFYQVSPQDYRKRRYRHRINEAVTRFHRFNALGMLPEALPYVVKPLAVGLLPHSQLEKLKAKREQKRSNPAWNQRSKPC